MHQVNKRKIGTQFEELAAAYLLERGYTILARSFRHRRGEIDIVAKDGDTVVFVEVKYRSHKGSGDPLEAVHFYKQKQITDAARFYLYRYGYSTSTPCRFDCIGIVDGHIRHISNAFDAVM